MKKPPAKRITASELLKQLKADPVWVASREAEERIREERYAQLLKAQLPLLIALREVDVDIESVWDLVNSAKPYPTALPVLVDHLRRPSYPDKVSEGIARALAVPEACRFWNVLVNEYDNTDGTTSPGKKDGLACAIAAASCDLHDILELVANAQHGDSRLLLLPALRRSKRPEAQLALSALANDPTFAKEIASWRKVKYRRDRKSVSL